MNDVRSKVNKIRAKNRITLTLICLVGAFVVLVGPSDVVMFVKEFDWAFKASPSAYHSFSILTTTTNLLQLSHYSGSFILYCAVNSDFRSIFVAFCRCGRSPKISRGTRSLGGFKRADKRNGGCCGGGCCEGDHGNSGLNNDGGNNSSGCGGCCGDFGEVGCGGCRGRSRRDSMVGSLNKVDTGRTVSRNSVTLMHSVLNNDLFKRFSRGEVKMMVVGEGNKNADGGGGGEPFSGGNNGGRSGDGRKDEDGNGGGSKQYKGVNDGVGGSCGGNGNIGGGSGVEIGKKGVDKRNEKSVTSLGRKLKSQDTKL